MSTALNMQPEIKVVWGKFLPDQEFKVLSLPGGVEVGVAKGFLATWDLDEGNDRFHRGAFLESIAEHRGRDNRQVRLVDEHFVLMGGFPIEEVAETEQGLEVTAHINLKHSKGADIWELVKQKVVVDFSIGFQARDWKIVDDVREIFKAIIWHGSTVSEPMNRGAQIFSFKSRVPLFPIASEDEEWNYDDAWKRIQESHFDPRTALIGRKCVCDVVEGQLTVIPKALSEAVEHVSDNLDEIRLVERYYSQMKKASPFDRKQRQYWSRADIEGITAKECETLLLESGAFSKKAARFLVSRIEGLDSGEDVEHDIGTSVEDIISELRGTRASLV